MHSSAYADAALFVENYLMESAELSIADVGSYDVNGTLKPLLSKPNWKYTGLDISAGPNVDVVLASPYIYPISHHGKYDVVVSTQCAEHVPEIWNWIGAVASLCRPGGLVYISTPNTIGYHAYPLDCWRIWPDGMKALMAHAGLYVVQCYARGIDTTGIARKLDRA